MADYTLVHPVWDNVTRVAQSAQERDRYTQAGWVLKGATAPALAPKTTAASKAAATKDDAVEQAPDTPTGTETN